jgi:Phospholipase A2-like domain
VSQKGGGIVDKFIENLPFELHLLGSVHKEPFQSNDASLVGAKEGNTRRMEFCGPGTKFDLRNAKGERGINLLDHAAYYHDLAYKSKDAAARNRADSTLCDAAERYLTRPHLSALDKIDARIVEKAMKLIKRKE